MTRRNGQPTTFEELSSPASQGLRTVQFGEQAKTFAALVGQALDYNPDDLVIHTGDGVRIYQDMLRDPYVKGALNLKKFGVSRLPTKILPASESERDHEIAKFVEWNLENMETPLLDMLWGVMDSVDSGYSISELVWQMILSGRFQGKIGFKAIKSKDPFVYSFKIDDFGNILYVYQRYGSTVATRDEEDLNIDPSRLDKEKFAIMSFMPKYSNPYGSSDLRAAYRAFFIKDWAWKFRSIFMEKYGMPPIAGFFPNGTPQERIDKMLEVLESIQNDTAIAIPDDLKIEILELARSGPTEYERAIADLNKEILIGILGSFMAVEEGKRTGARAAGQVHMEVSKFFIEHLAGAVQETMNRQIIRKLVDVNFIVDGAYPKWVFDVSDVSRLLSEIKIDQTLVELGVQLPERYWYEKYNRPMPDEASLGRRLGPDVGFEAARDDAMPEEPEKIAQLRDMYRFWTFAEFNRVGRLISKVDSRKIGYDMAGKEREYFKKHGNWMSCRQAYLKFVERLDEEKIKRSA